MQNQKKIWDSIAEEWDEFKKMPSKQTIEFLKSQKGNILDLGSGSGRNITKIKNGKMYLVDFSEEMIKFAEKRAKNEKIKAEFSVSDISKIPYKDNFFDAAISISALHCIQGKEKREKIIKELFRVLKPGAKAKIGVWNKNSKRFKNSSNEKYIGWRDKGKRYYYLHTEEEIQDLFKKIGFDIISSSNTEMMINFIAQKPKT